MSGVTRILALKHHIFLEQYVKTRLMPFIKNNYPMSPYIVWPDIASFHYANSVVNFPKSKNLKCFLTKISKSQSSKSTKGWAHSRLLGKFKADCVCGRMVYKNYYSA